MPPRRSSAWPTTLLLALLSTATAARDNFNLTLTFSPSTNDTTTSRHAPCTGRDDPDSITFSTYFLPRFSDVGGCVNLAEAFAGNTSSLPTGYSYNAGGTINITFSTDNAAAYDPGRNYSQVLYTQPTYFEDQDHEDDARYFSARNVYFYPGENCLQTGTDADGDIFPWYLSDCRAVGDCQRFPFGVRSFRVVLPDTDDSEVFKRRERKNKCVLGAEYGAGSVVRPSWVVGMLVGAVGLMVVVVVV